MIDGLNPQLFEQARTIMASSGGLKGEDYFNSGLKRKLDMVVSALGITASSPIILMASALVYAQDRHNPYFDNGFVNPGTGKYSSFWKIRSMVPNANLLENSLVDQGLFYPNRNKGNDHRVTPIGRFLRKTSVDELPQFLDVLCGDYSMVGPRKYTETEWQKLIVPQASEELVRELLSLLKQGMKFGVTGLATILARNSQSPNIINERLALNNYYGQQANFIADLRIIGLTPGVLFQGR